SSTDRWRDIAGRLTEKRSARSAVDSAVCERNARMRRRGSEARASNTRSIINKDVNTIAYFRRLCLESRHFLGELQQWQRQKRPPRARRSRWRTATAGSG